MAASVLHEMQMLVIEIQILFDNRPRDYRKEVLRLIFRFYRTKILLITHNQWHNPTVRLIIVVDPFISINIFRQSLKTYLFNSDYFMTYFDRLCLPYCLE